MKNIIIEEKISHILKTIDELSDIVAEHENIIKISCLLYTSPSPRDATLSRMPSSA